MSARILSFGAVDGLGFAAATGQLGTRRPSIRYRPNNLGPLLEIVHLAAGGRVPSPTTADWLDLDGVAGLMSAFQDGRECWVNPSDRRMGFIKPFQQGPNSSVRWTGFLMDAQRAARHIAGLSGKTSGQLAASMTELESNILEHSSVADTGIVAFQAKRSHFEFVVADLGIGVLKSLQSSEEYAVLADHGKALELALTDGISRFGTKTQRGHGFRPIFIGLANLHCYLRFRSGDHALTIDGSNPNLAMAQLAQKPEIDGFFASVTCGWPSS